MSAQKYVFKPYSESFPRLFAQEKARIEQMIHVPMAIEPIGSSAVRGLGGKGVIDIGISVDKADIELVSKQLQELGYVVKAGLPQFSAPYRRFLIANLHDPEETVRRYHIHLMEPTNPEWNRFLAFRDYLRDHPEACQEYAAVKEQAASEANGSGEKYRELKSRFFKKFIEAE